MLHSGDSCGTLFASALLDCKRCGVGIMIALPRLRLQSCVRPWPFALRHLSHLPHRVLHHPTKSENGVSKYVTVMKLS